MTNSLNRKYIGFLDGTMLKIIAMVCMVFDHVGDFFFPEVMWPRMVGRLAMPSSHFVLRKAIFIPETRTNIC